MTLRDMTKAVVGQAAALSPQCRYDRAIFILAHMRCGSTALSNILCSRPDVSGYGEAHVRYDDESALGRLVVNQALRRAWKPGARHLFDKILHNRHDAAAPKAFFAARAIFVVREPGAAIRSIRKLYADLGRDEYGTDVEATEYYVERLQAMARMWGHFSAERRVGVSHSGAAGGARSGTGAPVDEPRAPACTGEPILQLCRVAERGRRRSLCQRSSHADRTAHRGRGP